MIWRPLALFLLQYWRAQRRGYSTRHWQMSFLGSNSRVMLLGRSPTTLSLTFELEKPSRRSPVGESTPCSHTQVDEEDEEDEEEEETDQEPRLFTWKGH